MVTLAIYDEQCRQRLGNIKNKADAQQLQNVTVTASKPLLTKGDEPKIFNVEKTWPVLAAQPLMLWKVYHP